MLKKSRLFGFLFILAGTSGYTQTLSVSAPKMNVLYIGVDNPVLISSEGISSKILKVSISGGKLKKN